MQPEPPDHDPAAPAADPWTAWLNRLPSPVEEVHAPIRPGLGLIVGAVLGGFWLSAGVFAWRAMGA